MIFFIENARCSDIFICFTKIKKKYIILTANRFLLTTNTDMHVFYN